MSMSKFFNLFENGLINGKNEIRGEIIGRDEFDGILVDTCWTEDTGWYETYISTPEFKEVVEQYGKDREKAIKGHKNWVKKMKKNPKRKLKAHISAVDWATGNY